MHKEKTAAVSGFSKKRSIKNMRAAKVSHGSFDATNIRSAPHTVDFILK